MIKGWRNDPNWVSIVDSRLANQVQARQLNILTAAQRKMNELQEEYNARQKDEIARQEAHRRECHAQHEAAGTLTSQIRGKPN